MLKKETTELPSISRASFERDGFLVFRNSLDESICEKARTFVLDSLQPLIGPAELEVDVGYPGAPAGDKRLGARLRETFTCVWSRADYASIASHENVRRVIYELMEDEAVVLSYTTTVLTKFPKYSSVTGWRRIFDTGISIFRTRLGVDCARSRR